MRWPRWTAAAARPQRAVIGCDAAREAVSARLDGEDPGHPLSQVDGHLAGCAGCRSYQDQSIALRRGIALRPAQAPPPAAAARLVAATTAGVAPVRRRPALPEWLPIRLAPIPAVALAALLAVGLGLPAHVHIDPQPHHTPCVRSLHVSLDPPTQVAAGRPRR